METWEINGHTLEYDDDTHTYIADGLIIPSVTQMIKKVPAISTMYDGISAEVVRRAGERGTLIHKQIEEYCKTGEESDSLELRGFKFLQKNYDIVALANEVPVLLSDKDKPIVAGRLDLLALVNGKYSILDIKTYANMSQKHKIALTYQLNLYRVAYEQSYGSGIEYLAGLHIREHTRKLVEVKINDFAVKEVLE